jgi:hypothetical protein
MADAAKKKEDLVKEVKMTVHLKDPLSGAKDLAREFGFTEPQDIDHYLTNGLSNAEADVRVFFLLTRLSISLFISISFYLSIFFFLPIFILIHTFLFYIFFSGCSLKTSLQ